VLAARFISLEVHESTHDRLVWGMRQNRDRAVAGVTDRGKLREVASQIEEHTITHLDQYLEQFEANAANWARTSTRPATPRSTTRRSPTSSGRTRSGPAVNAASRSGPAASPMTLARPNKERERP
jgi:hypothetical protein